MTSLVVGTSSAQNSSIEHPKRDAWQALLIRVFTAPRDPNGLPIRAAPLVRSQDRGWCRW